MARIIQEKFLFIHCIKTGGTFFKEVLSYYGVPNRETGDFSQKYFPLMMEEHYGLSKVYELHPETKELISFGFVRNPITWYKSKWAHGVMSDFGLKLKVLPDAQAHRMAPVWSDDFNQFVANCIEHYPEGECTYHFKTMLGLFTGKQVFEVGRFEDLILLTAHWLRRFRVQASIQDLRSIPIPRGTDSIKATLSPEMEKELTRVEYKVFEAYY